MANINPCLVISTLLLLLLLISLVTAQSPLSPNFYDKVCPQALPAIREVVESVVKKEPRMGASILRLHFHDCFVNGCDGSVLLDDTPTMIGEKTAGPNNNSARGFDVIDQIKAAVDKACNGSVVSCADILTVTARDSIVVLGGPTWSVPLGRRDTTNASKDDANTNIPAPFFNLTALIDSFKSKGLELRDLVALTGAHTIGQARCVTFRNRIYNDKNIDSVFANSLRQSCPYYAGDSNLAPLDPFSPQVFGFTYYWSLLNQRGLLHSDQELFNGGDADSLTKEYALNPTAFIRDFARSMVKMGNISPLTGSQGEVRVNCRRVNS